MNKTIHMQALKLPDRPHYEWSGEWVEQNDDYVMVLCKPGRKLVHHTKNNVFTINNTSLELFFLKEWYTVAIGIEEGKVVSYYCNVAMPSLVTDEGISFVDLDLDLIKGPGGDWQVVDEDEFAANSVAFGYSAELQSSARIALARLLERARSGRFPFDDSVLSRLPGADSVTRS
ncbi:DUF402 domain-containing protein [Paenibacillus sp. 1P07SE]|uniref:DUF402 domain-containing protein n=1 Tax=Paenibacillus sp. 1P07SE TaxID=3132209 RepID=UPI0039A6EF91